MRKKKEVTKTREELYQEKAQTYITCYSDSCLLREHCLRSILNQYAPKDAFVTRVINLNNPEVQTSRCPMYRSDGKVNAADIICIINIIKSNL